MEPPRQTNAIKNRVAFNHNAAWILVASVGLIREVNFFFLAT
jgi:hypothetical protein